MISRQSLAANRSAVSRVFGAAACAAVVLAAPAVAGASEQQSSVTIRYERASLRDVDAARDFLARIRTAARAACGDADIRVLYELRAVIACRQNAAARAIERIDSPTLSALHRESVGDDSIRLASDG